MSGHRITETDGGFWPTPDTRGFVNEGSLGMLSRMCDSREEYETMAHRAGKKKKERFWPTPTTRDHKGARKPEAMASTGRNPETNSLPDSVGAHSGLSLNPYWVEWLMGFPIGQTVLKRSAMPKSLSKQQQHSTCSQTEPMPATKRNLMTQNPKTYLVLTTLYYVTLYTWNTNE
jgi:hypothetical protein